jgi:hypothetical protein
MRECRIEKFRTDMLTGHSPRRGRDRPQLPGSDELGWLHAEIQQIGRLDRAARPGCGGAGERGQRGGAPGIALSHRKSAV